MYEFVDTIDTKDNITLPTEAVNINGDWLECQIPGYSTLNVQGREAVDIAIDDSEISRRDGSIFKSKTIKPRTLKITYQILADTAEDFREAFNRLLGILNKGELKLIFNDETDKYFTGYLNGFDSPESGLNKVTGAYYIYCPDPLKYAVDETEIVVEPENREEIVVNYNGTAPIYPQIKAYANSALGYISYIKDELNSVVIGDETIEIVPEPVELFSTNFETDTQLDDYDFNIGTIDPTTEISDYYQEGSTAATTLLDASNKARMVNDWGSNPYDSLYHGPSIRRNFSNDPATSFYAYLGPFFMNYPTGDSQEGFFQINFEDWTDNNNPISVVSVTYLMTLNPPQAICIIKIAGEEVERINFDSILGNAYSGLTVFDDYASAPYTVISKTNSVISVQLGENLYQYDIEEAADLSATEMTIAYGKAKDATDAPYMGIQNVTFYKYEYEGQNYIINQGDTVIADCPNADIIFNGASKPGMGRINNAWEEMFLENGENKLLVHYPFGVEEKPTVTFKFREAYL